MDEVLMVRRKWVARALGGKIHALFQNLAFILANQLPACYTPFHRLMPHQLEARKPCTGPTVRCFKNLPQMGILL